MAKIPLASAEKLLKDAGAERVSHEAKVVFVKLLEEHGQIMAQRAKKIANHSGRRTVMAVDVRLQRDLK